MTELAGPVGFTPPDHAPGQEGLGQEGLGQEGGHDTTGYPRLPAASDTSVGF